MIRGDIMRSDVEELLERAAQERAIAAAEGDYLKRSHHEEFADRYLAEALALTRNGAPKAAAGRTQLLDVLTDCFKQLCSLRLFPRKVQLRSDELMAPPA
jgi:hypothetical protein